MFSQFQFIPIKAQQRRTNRDFRSPTSNRQRQQQIIMLPTTPVPHLP
jgi:hypothetical protein